MKNVYIVTAYRWGDRSNHSYNLGVFDKSQEAINCAESHTIYRGGKYGCAVDEVTLNNFDNEMDDYTKEIYRTKSIME